MCCGNKMASSESDMTSPSASPPPSYYSTTRERGRGRKRYRESSSSMTSKKRHSQSVDEIRSTKMFESTDILCLYSNIKKPNSYPAYIRYTKKLPSPVDTIIPVNMFDIINENTARDLTQFGTQTLNAEQTQVEEYFFECARIFLGSLKLESQISESKCKWFNNCDMAEKEERCEAIRKNYGISILPSFTGLLIGIYEAFCHGFSDAYGRKALVNLYRICMIILGKYSEDRVTDIGGGMHDGNTTTLNVYSEIGSLTNQKEAEELLRLEKAECKTWVPDCLMYNRKSKGEMEYYFYGECKSGCPNKHAVYHQSWHGSLRGLIDTNSVYSCGICSVYMILCKLCVNGNSLRTYKLNMNFTSPSEDGISCDFNIENFLTCIKYVTKIVQDKIS